MYPPPTSIGWIVMATSQMIWGVLMYLLSCGFLSGTTFCLCVMAIVFPLTEGSGFNVDSSITFTWLSLPTCFNFPQFQSKVSYWLVLYLRSIVFTYTFVRCDEILCSGMLYMYMYMQVCTMLMWIY